MAPEENLGEVFVLLGLALLCRTDDVNPGRGELDGLGSVHLVEVDTGGLRQQVLGLFVWLEEDCSVMLR